KHRATKPLTCPGFGNSCLPRRQSRILLNIEIVSAAPSTPCDHARSFVKGSRIVIIRRAESLTAVDSRHILSRGLASGPPISVVTLATWLCLGSTALDSRLLRCLIFPLALSYACVESRLVLAIANRLQLP